MTGFAEVVERQEPAAGQEVAAVRTEAVVAEEAVPAETAEACSPRAEDVAHPASVLHSL